MKNGWKYILQFSWLTVTKNNTEQRLKQKKKGEKQIIFFKILIVVTIFKVESVMDGLGGVEHSHWNYNWFSKLKIALIFIFILMLCIRMYTKSFGSYGVIAYRKKKTVLTLDTIISFHL